MSLSREEWRELREALARECLNEIAGAGPELDDPRLGYVSLQVDRDLWLRCRAMPSDIDIALREIDARAGNES